MSPTNLIANTYNPHNQTPDELINGFVVRTKEFEALYNDVKTDRMQHPPQHVIIQGRRGSGKTSFLLRIYHEVRRDASVNKWLLPLIFNEELYAVRTLYKLWELVARELETHYEEFLSLPDAMEARIEASDFEEICFDLLIAALRQQKKKLLLLIDNFGDILQKFSEREQQRLREVLITCPDIKIIGASSVALEATFDYAKPFFEFFKIVELAGLSKEETTTLLLALGEHYQQQQIKTIVEEKPGKIETLRRLTDGVPRTMILLFEIFVDDAAGDSFKDLEMVLDRVTPLYKHRMDELSAQQQELVDIIALQWDAMPVKEIAQKSRMESKAVSAQLRQLEKNRIIIKKTTSTKNHLYQISERFFNIWYLMRCGRKRDKSQVRWLTRFLEEWCSGEELVERAKGHLGALQGGKVYEPCAYYMTEALARTVLPYEIQDSLIKETRSYLKKKGSLLSEQLSESDAELFEKARIYFNQEKYDLAIKMLDSIHLKTGVVFYSLGLCYNEIKNVIQAERYYKKAIEKGCAGATFNLAMLYQEKKDADQAERHYLMAIDNGDVDAMFNLALLYQKEIGDFNQAEKYYMMAIEKGCTHAMVNLALFYEIEGNDLVLAEKYYKMAIENGDSNAMYNLAVIYSIKKKDVVQAEKYYKLSIEKGGTDAAYNLACLYEIEKKDIEQAEKYYKIASDNGHVKAQVKLAHDYFLQRNNKAAALEYITKAWEQDLETKLKLYYPLILLWNDDFEKSASIAKPFFENPDILENEYPVKQYLLLLIAKNQYNFAHRLFRESPLNLRERYRPIYYALMYFMQSSHPDEFRKIGSELEETVMEIVAEIKKMGETM